MSRNVQNREIETDRTAPRPDVTNGDFGLQQIRYSPERPPGVPSEALARSST